MSDVLGRYELQKKEVLDSWDVQPDGTEHSPHPPLTVFLDWMYGQYLHSDAEKAQRIKELDGGQGRPADGVCDLFRPVERHREAWLDSQW